MILADRRGQEELFVGFLLQKFIMPVIKLAVILSSGLGCDFCFFGRSRFPDSVPQPVLYKFVTFELIYGLYLATYFILC